MARILRRRRRADAAFAVLGAVLVVLCLGVLAVLVADLVRDALPRLGPEFLSSFPSRRPEQAGIKSALVGTTLVMLVTATVALPLGVAAGIYLEEYARKNWLTGAIEINIANLAGVPSIVWGLMALGLLVYQLGFGRNILTAGITLGLLVLPVVIVATRESVRAIPQGLREGSYACGATRWQTVSRLVLPGSLSGILTGSIIALSRAIGETAPLITIGALTYIAFLPPSPVTSEPPFVSLAWLESEFTVLPIQLFNWVSRPDPRFLSNAAAAGVVLLAVTLGMNALAIFLRYRLRKRYSA
ncbi:MAG TPA: phosphate ABC transporter permease PstA [Planctomycetota bacterium]